MTRIPYLEEIHTSLPESLSPHRFRYIENQMLLVDMGKTIGAKTFDGMLVDDNEMSSPMQFVKLFFDGGFVVDTIFTDELKNELYPDAQGSRADRFDNIA